MRVDEACTELDELDVHCVVHTGGITFKVRTSALERTFLIIVVKTNIIGIISTTTAEVHTVVLANTRLEGFIEPVCIRIIAEVVFSVSAKAIASRNRNTGIFCCNAKILAVLIGIHDVVNILLDLINTKVTLIIYFQRLILLTALCGDDNHTVSSTRTVDGTGRSILQHLNGLDIVW